jgi:tRNA A58 N-methylase Trm61
MTMHSDETASAGSTYTLGHSDAEIQRLLLQGRIYNQHTANALRMAGLQPGMRVLDVGCGPGDVSIVASQLVGPTGTVVGVDASADVIELAVLNWVRVISNSNYPQSKTFLWTSRLTP